MRPVTLSRIRDDQSGIAAVEFAVIAPVFLLLMMGGMDIGHTLYTQAILQGVVQKAARDASLEDGSSAAERNRIDAKVRSSVADINNTANVAISRRYYRSFSNAAVAQAESWTDTNTNGRCDNNEPYVDANRNMVWDADGADEGQGGARDVTVYKVTMTYPRFFPTIAMIGYFIPSSSFSPNVSLTAQTVLANQPYSDQQTYGAPVTRNCT
jgi:Flp pilus assembly protein TadG